MTGAEPGTAPRGTARYRALLAFPGAPVLVAAGLLARLSLGMITLALVLAVQAQRGSFATATVVSAGYAVAGAVSGPVRGRLVDRRGPVMVLVVCGVGQAAGFTALVLVLQTGGPVAGLVVPAALAGALTPPTGAVMRALWGHLTTDAAVLRAAYAVEGVLVDAVFVLGPLAVGLLAVAGEPATGLLVAAGSALVGTCVLAARLRAVAWPCVDGHSSVWGPLAAGSVECPDLVADGHVRVEVRMRRAVRSGVRA